MATYTYTIFDANPAQSGPSSWPSHEDIEIEADSDDGARELVRAEIESEALGLDAPDYSPGDKIWANIWDEDGIVQTISVEVPAD